VTLHFQVNYPELTALLLGHEIAECLSYIIGRSVYSIGFVPDASMTNMIQVCSNFH